MVDEKRLKSYTLSGTIVFVPRTKLKAYFLKDKRYFRQTFLFRINHLESPILELRNKFIIQATPDNNNFFGSQKLLLTEHCYYLTVPSSLANSRTGKPDQPSALNISNCDLLLSELLISGLHCIAFGSKLIGCVNPEKSYLNMDSRNLIYRPIQKYF